MVALVVIVGIGFTIYSSGQEANVPIPVNVQKLDPTKTGAALTPVVLDKKGYGISFNSDITPALPTIDIWEDFQCPVCKVFEDSLGSYIESLIREKRANVIFHLVSFLGPESVVAANAALCSIDEGQYLDFHKALYEVQSATENSGFFSAKNLVAIGAKVKMTAPTFKECVTNQKYGKIVENIYKDMAPNNVNGTPTVFFNGKLWERKANNFDLNEFVLSFEAAANSN